MQCRFRQWRPQFDDWYISCFRIKSFPNNSQNIIACLYIHISLCCSLTYYINILSVASVIFCHYYPKSDVVELIIMLISAWLMEIQLLLEGITKWFKILVACNGASEIFFSQAYNRLQHLVRFSPYLLFLEFFWTCKISYNSCKFQIKISWINIP